MMKKPEVKKTVLDKATVSRILRTVPQHEGFRFFRETGDSTGKTATSLADFVEKLRTVDIRSVNFHFPRQDFEKWLRNTIGDAEMSTRISRIKRDTHGEKLRNEIIQVVKGRIDELKGMQTKP
jgi:alpha-amylase